MDIFKIHIARHKLSDELYSRAVEFALPDNAIVFQIEGSNVNLDAYYTHMTRKTLSNFAADAEMGVQFLDGHNNRNLGYGRTFGGRVKVDKERQPVFDVPDGVELALSAPSQYAYFQGDVYTIPGINFGGGLTYASTDDFIRAMDAGLAADVSVGFSGGNWRCDICGGDYRNYGECSHFGGMIYPVGERRVLATISIDGARLHEVSAVYDGATPNASILKARQAAEEGELSRDEKRVLEMRYKVDLPTKAWAFSGYSSPAGSASSNLWKTTTTSSSSGGAWIGTSGTAVQPDGITYYPFSHEIPPQKSEIEPDKENRTMSDETRTPDSSDDLTAVREVLAETGAPENKTVAEQVRWLAGEVERLRPLADDGRVYRDDLITETLAEGVRALGDGFNQETYRGLLERSGIAAIKQMRTDWATIAEKRWPKGRQTVDGNDDEQPPAPRSVVPDEAYS